eukprot:gene17768-biopygen8539
MHEIQAPQPPRGGCAERVPSGAGSARRHNPRNIPVLRTPALLCWNGCRIASTRVVLWCQAVPVKPSSDLLHAVPIDQLYVLPDAFAGARRLSFRVTLEHLPVPKLHCGAAMPRLKRRPRLA